MGKIAGVKINKTATGKIKSVELDYKKFSDYVDDFLDALGAEDLLKEPTRSLRDVLAEQDKKRNFKR